MRSADRSGVSFYNRRISGEILLLPWGICGPFPPITLDLARYVEIFHLLIVRQSRVQWLYSR